MTERALTNNSRGEDRPCRLIWTFILVPIILLVGVQRFGKDLYKAVKGPSTRLIVISMISWSYSQRRRRLNMFDADGMNSLRRWQSLVRRRPGERFLLKDILETNYHQIWTEVHSMTQITPQQLQLYFQIGSITHAPHIKSKLICISRYISPLDQHYF